MVFHLFSFNLLPFIFRCEGTCTNLLLCSISGGETVKDHSCKGLFSVCCQTKPVQAWSSNQSFCSCNLFFSVSVFPARSCAWIDQSSQTTIISHSQLTKTWHQAWQTSQVQKTAVSTKATRTTTKQTKDIFSASNKSNKPSSDECNTYASLYS